MTDLSDAAQPLTDKSVQVNGAPGDPKPGTPGTTASKERIGVLATALLSTCLTLLALSPFAYVVYKHMPPSVATVDLQRLVEEEQKSVLDLMGGQGASATPEQRAIAEKHTAEFAKRLSIAVDQLGQDCRCVLVNTAALLTGSVSDYTDVVRERIRGAK